MKRALFGDTYIKKHYDCVLPLVNDLTRSGVAPILTAGSELPSGIECDCLVYFNRPAIPPPSEYSRLPRVLIDHGASNLKWFLASEQRFNFFDLILTAGPDHVSSLRSFFPGAPVDKVKSVGFVKSPDLLGAPRESRESVCARFRLDPSRPVILFAPTWHISANRDMESAIRGVSRISNHVACLHPETVHLNVSGLNVAENVPGLVTELLKHADCVVSDTSSTLFEAAALGKRIVQIALREYSDNNAVLFDNPYTAGLAELFSAGLVCRPHQVEAAVARSLGGDDQRWMALMRSRILRGTLIDADVGLRIAREILEVCDKEVDERRHIEADLRRVNGNLFFAKQRLIAHGCGEFEGLNASNSAEAFSAAVRAAGMVEIDVVESADGLIIATHGSEAKYGLTHSFAETTSEDFQGRRFAGTLKPISLRDALIIARRQRRFVVADIYAHGTGYRRIVERLRVALEANECQDALVLQCYSAEDVEVASELGFERILLAVGKFHYEDPLGDASLRFLDDAIQRLGDCVVGLSIPYSNEHMSLSCLEDPRLDGFRSLWRRIFVHGAPRARYPDLLRSGLGVFAEGFDAEIGFADHPPRFGWREYLFLNPGLIDVGIDNEVSAVVHYVKHGQREGRMSRYDVPDGFRYAEYVDLNPDLRKGGVSGADSARAHWTKFGQHEGRKYSRSMD